MIPKSEGRNLNPEFWIALLLTGIVIGWHLIRLGKAGGLWRDEAATAHLASQFSFRYVMLNAQYELFPVLLPALLHGYNWLAGTSDLALRFFGTFVGLSIIAALWWNMWSIHRGFPLISLALLGFNGDFIQWGDQVRGYGLGIFFIIMTAGLVWHTTNRPNLLWIAGAMLAAVASVQCLFNNACLVLSVCLAAATMAWWKGLPGRATLALALGLPAAISLLPYLGPLGNVRQWDMLVRVPADVGRLSVLEHFCQKMLQLLTSPGWWVAAFWLLLLLLAVVVCLVGRVRKKKLGIEPGQRGLLIFGGAFLAFSIVFYFVMLLSVEYPTQVWYYLPLAACAALGFDVIFATLRLRWVRSVRLVCVIVVAATSFVGTIRAIRVRQSTSDLAAAKLARFAVPGDLIIVAPWYYGISFERYYHGQVSWMTLPPIEFHKFHRFDLIKPYMLLPDQNEPVRALIDKISEVFKAGHRVWVAGIFVFPEPGTGIPVLSAAPDATWGWQEGAYTTAWTLKVAAYLRGSATATEEIPLSPGPVNRFEDFSLKMFKGPAAP